MNHYTSTPPSISAGQTHTLQQDATGRLLCKCPKCGDEWMVSTWPKLEREAKAQGWEEAMERVEEVERHSVDKALSYAIGLIERLSNEFPRQYLVNCVGSHDPGAWSGFESAKIRALMSLDEMRRKLRAHVDIYNEKP